MGLFGVVDSYDNKGPVGGATNPLTGAALARDRENQRAILELDGTQAYESISILDGSISPKRAEIIVDTEGGASADTLETILTNTDGSTTLHDGMKLTLRSADSSRSVTVKHSNSEFGIQMVDGQDVILGTKWGLKLKLIANKWFEDQGRIDLARLAAGSDAVTPTPTPNTIMSRDEAGRVRVLNPVHVKDVANKEYVDFNLLRNASVGLRQTWQNLTASRAVNTTYINTAERPIQVSVILNQIGGGIELAAGTVIVARCGRADGTGNGLNFVQAIIPPGGLYRINLLAGAPEKIIWSELR